jgi:hypothetical protein
VKLDIPIPDLKRMAEAAQTVMIEHATREAVDDEILAYRLQYGVVGYLLGVVLAQARNRNSLGDTTDHDAALEIINEVAGVTGHRVAPSDLCPVSRAPSPPPPTASALTWASRPPSPAPTAVLSSGSAPGRASDRQGLRSSPASWRSFLW